LGAATAQADYTVTTCGGNPAPRWVEGLDSGGGFAAVSDGCTTGGASVFQIAGTSMTANTDAGVGLRSPSGVAFTHITVHYTTLASSGTSQAFMRIEHDGSLLVDAPTASFTSGADLNVDVPDATDLTFNVYCTNGGSPCSFAGSGILTVGAMTLTVHDTGHPTVTATGGNLAAAGTYSGVQTLSFTASDTGSGVDHVTVALGATVLATAQSSCQTYNLAPCPPTTSGTLDVDTALVPDGTYPVALTAYDASGNPAPVQVTTVAIRNHTGTQSLPRPTKPRSVHTKVELTWHWTPASTVLTKLTIRKLARSATITVGCAGRRCPFKTRRGDGRHATRFVKAMERRVFHTGQKLIITIAQPHLTSERFRITIRRNRKPLAKPL
jgi:hypothetical protein